LIYVNHVFHSILFPIVISNTIYRTSKKLDNMSIEIGMSTFLLLLIVIIVLGFFVLLATGLINVPIHFKPSP